MSTPDSTLNDFESSFPELPLVAVQSVKGEMSDVIGNRFYRSPEGLRQAEWPNGGAYAFSILPSLR